MDTKPEEGTLEPLTADEIERGTNGKQHYEVAKALEDQTKAFYQTLYVKASSSLYIFNKYVLGVEKGKAELAQFHKDLCRHVTDDMHKKKLILVPRGHLKSTLITIGYSTWRIVQNPNIRILILSATYKMAVDFLTEIKNNLMKNERIKTIWGDLSQGATEWGRDRITLARTDMNIKGPTVWAAGIETNLVGSHPDVIILDDLHTRDNVGTREQIEKVILRYKDCLDLLETNGQLIVIGTRWMEEDFYGWLMDKDAGVVGNYDVLVQAAYEGGLEEGEACELIWPQKFTKKILRNLLKEKGWYEFSSQYRNDPIPSEDAVFKREYFQYFDLEDMRAKVMTKVMTVDPAISMEKESDYTAIVVTGIDQFGNIFILDVWRGKVRPKELIDQIFLLYGVWQPKTVAIETIAFQKALAYSLREEMQLRHKYLPITEVKSHDRSKDQRIQGMQPQYEQRKVFHRSGHPMIPYFEHELIAFPRGKNDDMIDSASFALDFLFAPKPKQTRFHHKYLY